MSSAVSATSSDLRTPLVKANQQERAIMGEGTGVCEPQTLSRRGALRMRTRRGTVPGLIARIQRVIFC